ncbi:MAG: hypothetical protein Q9221_003631 [Calogaya cf. arnoldii]
MRTAHRILGEPPLDPLAVYQCAIRFLTHYCRYGWTQPFPGMPFHVPTSPIRISVQVTAAARQTPLQINHVFFALQEAITIFINQEHDLHYGLYNVIYIDDRPIGVVRIERGGSLPPPISENADEDMNNWDNKNDTTINEDDDDDSGTYIPGDPIPTYQIPYTSSPHVPLPQHSIFTAIINAIIIITHDGAMRPFDSLNAFSAQGDVKLEIHTTTPEDKQFAIFVIKPFLERVTMLIARVGRFEEMVFAYEEGPRGTGPRIWRRFEGSLRVNLLS